MYQLYAYTCKLRWYVGTKLSASHPNVPIYQPSIEAGLFMYAYTCKY